MRCACASPSLLAGNIYVFIALKTETIDRATRVPLFVVFSIVSGLGLVLFILIIWRSYIEKRRDTPDGSVVEEKRSTMQDISHTLRVAGQLLRTRNMLLLLIPFAYSGMQVDPLFVLDFMITVCLGFSQTFFQGVYGTCIGHYVKYGGRRLCMFLVRRDACVDRCRHTKTIDWTAWHSCGHGRDHR